MKKIIYIFYTIFLLFVASSVGCSSGSSSTKTDATVRNPNDPVVTNTAVIETNLGNIEIELYGLDAPKTVANFVGLADSSFYEGILFHRVVPNFVIQAGDPNTKDPSKKHAWGTGGSSIYGGATFADELKPSPSYNRGYVPGCLAMANRGPNTNTSQFFICLDGAGGLQLNYTIFGKVIKGMDIVYKIEKAELVGSVPKENIVIKSVKTKAVSN